jgi:hypothetical protein
MFIALPLKNGWSSSASHQGNAVLHLQALAPVQSP